MPKQFVWLLIVLCLPLHAADLEVTSSRTGYSLTVTGTLREGDFRTLTEIFRGRGEFPTVTRIAIEGGDLAEARRLGALYRSAHLSVLALDRCPDACFLWLVGGASRMVEGAVELGFRDELPPNVRDYLSGMGVSSTTLDMLAASPTEGDLHLSPDRFAALVGERAESFDDRVAEECGRLSAQEEKNLAAIQASGFFNVLISMKGLNPERDDLDEMISKYRDLAAANDALEDSYRQALLSEWQSLQDCRRRFVENDQQRVLAGLS